MNFDYFYNNKELDQSLINLTQSCLEKINSITNNWIKRKEDGTPLTKLDLILDELIFKRLNALYYKIPIVSEEREASKDIFKNNIYWLIDPLDGTRSYINGLQEYTTNIALIHNNVPTIGLIGHPPSNKIWYANKSRLLIIKETLKNKINIKNNIDDSFSIIASKENEKILTDYLSLFEKSKVMRISSSLKFCKLAENKAKLYPRFSSISKWDIAAGHAILNAAGGKLLDFNEKELIYSSIGPKTKPFFAMSNLKYKDVIFSNYNKLKKTFE